MKPTDEAIFGMASESSGRNASEPSGGIALIVFRGSFRSLRARSAGASPNLRKPRANYKAHSTCCETRDKPLGV